MTTRTEGDEDTEKEKKGCIAREELGRMEGEWLFSKASIDYGRITDP